MRNVTTAAIAAFQMHACRCAMPAMAAMLASLCLPHGALAQPTSLQPEIMAVSADTRLELFVGEGRTIMTDHDISEVAVVDPDVVDVVVGAPNRAHLLARGVGRTDVMLSDESGRALRRIKVTVGADLSAIRTMFENVLGENAITVSNVGDAIVLGGSAPSPGVAANAALLAARHVGSAENVVNMIDVIGRAQVHLRVRVAEVQRNVLRNLGFSLDVTSLDGGSSNPLSAIEIVSPQAGFDANRLRVSTSLWGAEVEALLTALEEKGLVRTLAEPNLTALSGETADLLAGGEVPIPVSQEGGEISIEFKAFGVALGFTPVVLSDGRISLNISTESSAVSDNLSYQIGDLRIPGFSVRRANTSVDLPSGGSIVIGGLLQNEIQRTIQSVPGLQSIPILGSLFSSPSFQQNLSELVITVTPFLVKETSPSTLIPPTAGTSANDLELSTLKKLNMVYAPDYPAPEMLAGYFGYMIE